MIVNKNSPFNPCITLESVQSKEYEGCYTVEASHSGIPIRLEIASRLLAAMIMNDSFDIKLLSRESVYKKTLLVADKLIETHNETCEVV